MKKYKLIGFYLIAILAFIFSIGSVVNAQLAENNGEQKRQIIIDSRHGFPSDTVVANGKDLKITFPEALYMVDMVRGAGIGAIKGGGVGGLTISRIDSHNYDQVEIKIKEDAFKEVTSGATDSSIYQLELASPLGAVRFIDRKDIAQLGNGDFDLKIEKMDHDLLKGTAKYIINSNPFVLLNLKVNDQELPKLKGGMILEIPYQGSEKLSGEDLNQLTLYKIEESGELTQIKNSRYQKTKENNLYDLHNNMDKPRIQALIKEAGSYGIGYAGDDKVAFKDISGWYQPYVNFVLARGIMDGKENNLFLPHAAITRGDLAYFLANMSDVNIENYTSNVFSDISNNHAYAKSIAWAHDTGIIKGYEDGTFKADQVITRQELAAMLDRYSKVFAKTYLPRTFTQKDFKDDQQIASYAKEAVYTLQQAGVINGRGNDRFVPLDNVTRAECAKMITTIMNGVMDGKTTFVPLD